MFKKLFQEKEIRLFILVAVLIGVIMSFMICAWQTPDETTHLYLIGYHTNNPEFSQNLINSLGMDCGRIEWDENASVDFGQLKSAMVKKPDYTVSEMIPKGFQLPLIFARFSRNRVGDFVAFAYFLGATIRRIGFASFLRVYLCMWIKGMSV